MSQIAQTVLEQLGGTGRLGAMLGAHSFMATEVGLTFRIKAKALKGINLISVVLAPDDTYRVELLQLKGVNSWTRGEFRDVDAVRLKPLLERETGLAFSL